MDQGAAFTGGAGDDSFVASNTTLTILDNLNGGAGTDTLAITDASATAFTLPVDTTTITGIENFTIAHTSDNAADSVTVDVSTLADARSVTVTNTGTAITGAGTDGVAITTKANVTSVTVSGNATNQDVGTATITDSGTNGASTTDKLATVTLTGLTGAVALASEALTTLNLNAAGGLVTNTDTVTTDTRALTINVNGGTNGGVTDAGATSLAVNIKADTTALGTVTAAAAKTASLTVDGKLTAGTVVVAAAETVNVAASAEITASTVTAAAATALNLSGAGDMTITQTAAADAVITSTGAGARTLTTAIAAGQKYVGGAGKDTVTFAATGTTASTLGDGDDTATFSAVAGTGGSVDAGNGIDTVELTAANAVTLSANANFEDDIANFEKLSIGAIGATATSGTISLANLDDINSVVSAGAAANTAAPATTTISGFKTGGTFEQTALFDTDNSVTLTGSFTGASDTFNLRAKGTNGFANVGVLTLASVETVNITLDDSDTTAATTMFDLNVDATSATSVVVTGDAGITFANSSLTALRTLDASGVTASGAAGVVTFTANAFDSTVIGGAGNDVLTGGAANDVLTGNDGTDALVGAAGADTISGGNGVDTITGGDGIDSITGGAGADIFILNQAATTGRDVITDFAAGASGDVLKFDISDYGLAGGTEYVGAISGVAVDSSDEILVLTGAGYASDEAAEDAIAARVTTDGLDVVAVYFNTTTNTAHVIYDADAGVDGTSTVVLVGQLSNITSLSALGSFTAANIDSQA